MDIFDAYKLLLESEEFQDFVKNEEGYYLVHGYLMEEKNKTPAWEFGFYNEQKDKIIVFQTEPIKRLPEEEVFKEGNTLNKLDLDKVKINLDEASKIAEQVRQEKYKSEQIMKQINILQNLHKQVWNITLVSTAFNIINIKIDSETGEMISSNIHSIMDLGVKKI